MKTARTLDADELFRYALGLLAGRAMAAAEVRSRLVRKAANRGDIDGVIAKLREYGCVDDERFAEGFAASRRDSGQFGAARVRRDLRQRSVAPSAADRAVDQAFGDTDEPELVRRWLERKYRNVNLQEHLSDPKKLASVWRKLRYAGFSSSAAGKVLRSWSELPAEMEEDDEPEP